MIAGSAIATPDDRGPDNRGFNDRGLSEHAGAA
jgi:hypothetical protein